MEGWGQVGAVRSLASSIGELGLLQPIGVVPDGARDGDFTLVFGRNRYEAHRELGRAAIESGLFDLDLADAEAAMIVENLHRKELDRESRCDDAERFAKWHKMKFPEMHGRGTYQNKTQGDQKPAASFCPPDGGSAVAAP